MRMCGIATLGIHCGTCQRPTPARATAPHSPHPCCYCCFCCCCFFFFFFFCRCCSFATHQPTTHTLRIY